MRVRRGKKPSGVRAGALQRVGALEARCDAIEREVRALSFEERLRQAMVRITELEEAEAQRKTG